MPATRLLCKEGAGNYTESCRYQKGWQGTPSVLSTKYIYSSEQCLCYLQWVSCPSPPSHLSLLEEPEICKKFNGLNKKLPVMEHNQKKTPKHLLTAQGPSCLSRTQQWNCRSCRFTFNKLEAGIAGQVPLISQKKNPKFLSVCKTKHSKLYPSYADGEKPSLKAAFWATGSDTSCNLLLTTIITDNCKFCWFKFSTQDPQLDSVRLHVTNCCFLVSFLPCLSKKLSLAAVTSVPTLTCSVPLSTAYFRLKWKCHPLSLTSPPSKHMLEYLHPYSYPDTSPYRILHN